MVRCDREESEIAMITFYVEFRHNGQKSSIEISSDSWQGARVQLMIWYPGLSILNVREV
jgi:hypothetical protein